MGPIVWHLQPPVMVFIDHTGESGLAGTDPAIWRFPTLFPLISVHCAASGCPWLLTGMARASLRRKNTHFSSRRQYYLHIYAAVISLRTGQYSPVFLRVLNATTGNKSSGSSSEEQGCSSGSGWCCNFPYQEQQDRRDNWMFSVGRGGTDRTREVLFLAWVAP